MGNTRLNQKKRCKINIFTREEIPRKEKELLRANRPSHAQKHTKMPSLSFSPAGVVHIIYESAHIVWTHQMILFLHILSTHSSKWLAGLVQTFFHGLYLSCSVSLACLHPSFYFHRIMIEIGTTIKKLNWFKAIM